MLPLDPSQQLFCRSTEQHIRLLSPAGCGKTASLLYRCLHLVTQHDSKPRFLIITFTKSASTELLDRLNREQTFEPLRGQTTITTLNAYGWRRIRDQVVNARLLKSGTDYHFAMTNQLHPVWKDNSHISSVVTRPGRKARTLLTVMDNVKSMGFIHTRDTNYELYASHLDSLTRQGLSWRVEEQFELLTDIGVLDRPKKGDTEGPSTSRRNFYDRFFIFWRKASQRLLEESTFTFEDQKYWTYLDIRTSMQDGGPKSKLSGVARYNHILVDEFQDINPLDLILIKALVERHQASLTIVGDDDQAIFEWRGASPEFILNPNIYFDRRFTDYQLEVNYRSPRNVVSHSQKLISHNRNRVPKRVAPVKYAGEAEIEVLETNGINQRLELVTELVRSTEYPGQVAINARLRRQLIPYQIYFASDGSPFKTALDLDVFGSTAFDDLARLLETWDTSEECVSTSKSTNAAIAIVDSIRRRPLGKKDRGNLRQYMLEHSPNSVMEAVSLIADYDGPKLSGKSSQQLNDVANGFLSANSLSDALRKVNKSFDGLQFDLERAEDDVFFTAPPLEQLGDVVEAEGFDVDELVDRINFVRVHAEKMRQVEEDGGMSEEMEVLSRPLHLMTATRAKGREFNTVILLDAVKGVWPHNRATTERQIEAERRLFYVAFTRAKERIVMLSGSDFSSTSPFIGELGLG